jgi:phosphoserine/homoserine phosphotransferase
LGKWTARNSLAWDRILFHAPDNVIREFPQFPAVHSYEDLKREFLKASNRQLSL